MSTPNADPKTLCRHLEHGFIVVTINRSEPADARYEAWAYAGPLDFDAAEPVCFGLGGDAHQALDALTDHLPSSPRRDRA